MNMIKKPVLMENSIQDYAWGSEHAIQSLLGMQGNGRPWAELWMGAHPKAPSGVVINSEYTAMDALISSYPEATLGARTANKFDNTLPFLFKVLAAKQPLSIQAHPDAAMAKQGFERENHKKIPIDAPHRNYRDSWPKPEIICAVEPFIALNGFRPAEVIASLLEKFCPHPLFRQIEILKNKPDTSGIKEMFKLTVLMSAENKKQAIETVVKNAEKDNSAESRWITRLYRYYPDDIGILSPLYLNIIRLEPFTAMFLPPGRMHAYLQGVGIELMANSDNVIRGGLTGKHMDIEELMRVVCFAPSDVEILHPVFKNQCESRYPADAEEFALGIVNTGNQSKCVSCENHGLEILLCMKGSAEIIYGENADGLRVKKGQSVFVPACAGAYEITGDSFFYKAFIPEINLTNKGAKTVKTP